MKGRTTRNSTPGNSARAARLEKALKDQIIELAHGQLEKGVLNQSEIARRAGLPPSAVSGILSGGLKHVTIDRMLRILEAIGFSAEFRFKKGAAAR